MGLKIPWGAIPVQVRILPRASYTAMKTIITFALLLVLPARAAVSQQATEPIRQAVMKSDLRNLVTAEEAYFADHVKYTADLSQVASFFRPRPGVIGLHITLTADGWTGSVGHEGTTTVCVIYVGSTAIPPATTEGKPVCREGAGWAGDTAAARAGIAAGNARWIAAFKRGDAGAVAALFAEDAVQFRRSGGVVCGRAATQSDFATLFGDNGSADATITTANVWLVDERAYETGKFTFTFHPAGKPPATNAGRYVTIWGRQADGSWKIVVDFGVPSDTAP